MRDRGSPREETGVVGPAVLLGLVGALLGAILGFFGGGVVAYTLCSIGDNFECMAALLLILTVPVGGLVGLIAGILIGLRRPRVAPGVDPTAPAIHRGPPVRREAPASSWLGVVGGLTIAFGAFGGWRTVHYSYEDLDRYAGVLTPGPESFGFLGGVFVLVGGTIRILRPAAPAPTVLIGLGATLAAIGLAWAIVDVLGVPDELRWELLLGYWWSLLGAALSLAAWLLDPRGRRRSAALSELEEPAGIVPEV